jgi:hypothetical protein
MTRQHARRFTADLQARIILGESITKDFEREVRTSKQVHWEVWSHRLKVSLCGLLRALEASSAPLLDGGAYLSGPDTMTVLAALRDGVEYRRNNPGDSDLALIASFRMLSYALGDDR